MVKIKVLFVCMGNICRSPTAHGVFRQLVRDAGLERVIEIDSAGTHAFYHAEEPPDRRAQAAAKERGIDLGDLRARHASPTDLVYYDYVLAMDRDNYQALHAICPKGMEHKISLFLEHAPQLGAQEVPDPYYGGPQGFYLVLDMIEVAADGLLRHICRRHDL